MAQFAEGTSVSPEKSQGDIAGLLMRYGATGYSYGWDQGKAAIMFRSHDRIIRFTVPLPDAKDPRFHRTETGRARRDPQSALDAEIRRRWRALHLVIKAKLEAVETGVTDFEAEFMAHIVLPSGQTVEEEIRERIAFAYEKGDPVDVLPGLPKPRAIES